MTIRHFHGLEKITKYRTDALLVPTVKHTGTHYMMEVLGYKYAKLARNGEVNIRKRACNNNTHDYNMINGHFDVRADTLVEMSKYMRTVIPLRHPALVAVSWKRRPKDFHHQGTFLDEWLKMCEVENAFHFPLETKPFKELEAFIGTGVQHLNKRIHSIGDYPERTNLQTARNFLEKDWALVEQALQTTIGRKFYDKSLCGVRP